MEQLNVDAVRQQFQSSRAGRRPLAERGGRDRRVAGGHERGVRSRDRAQPARARVAA
jgi:hypothetical protein